MDVDDKIHYSPSMPIKKHIDIIYILIYDISIGSRSVIRHGSRSFGHNLPMMMSIYFVSFSTCWITSIDSGPIFRSWLLCQWPCITAQSFVVPCHGFQITLAFGSPFAVTDFFATLPFINPKRLGNICNNIGNRAATGNAEAPCMKGVLPTTTGREGTQLLLPNI